MLPSVDGYRLLDVALGEAEGEKHWSGGVQLSSIISLDVN
jgi:hypothetical protein